MPGTINQSPSHKTRSKAHRHQRVGRACLEALEGRRLLSFSPAVDYPAYNPQAVATADFNNDGKLDLATAHYSNVSVRLGNGAGGFGPAQEFATGYMWPEEISSIAVADFNNDTKLDIAAFHGSGVSILMGNGDGAFQAAVNQLLGGFYEVAVGDFNNDSNIDVVTDFLDADWARRYRPWWGDGQGGFVQGWDSPLPAEGGLAAVDLNNDGSLDVAIADGQVLLGTFQFDYGQQPLLNLRYDAPVAPGDFNGDGNADLVSVSDSVAVLRGRGDGTFDAPILHPANGTVHTGVATADFNADGKLDAVVANGDASTVSLMLGNGDGTLIYAGAFATGASPSGVTVGDFDGDGRPDVAVANAGSYTVSVLLNDGSWTTPPPPSIFVSDATVTEGNAGTVNATFTVRLSQAADVDVTVQYSTANLTATTGGSDYMAKTGTVTIPAGQTSETFTVAILGDCVAEPTETFAVNLSSAINASIGDGQGIGTIIDDEPRLSIGDASIREGKSGTKVMTFTVTLSAAYDEPVTVNFATRDGTATAADSDYVATSGTLSFAPGETVKTIAVVVKGDRKREADEYFDVLLSAASVNALILPGYTSGRGTIFNDD